MVEVDAAADEVVVPVDEALSLVLTNASAAEPYSAPYPWWVFASLPLQQYGSAASQYDCIFDAEGHTKLAERASNYPYRQHDQGSLPEDGRMGNYSPRQTCRCRRRRRARRRMSESLAR